MPAAAALPLPTEVEAWLGWLASQRRAAPTTLQAYRRDLEALLRLAEGRYGECLCCGEAIEAARLAALPVAEYCLRCAEDREGHSNQAARLK